MDETFSYINEEELRKQISENFKLIDQFLNELKESNLNLSSSEKATA